MLNVFVFAFVEQGRNAFASRETRIDLNILSLSGSKTEGCNRIFSHNLFKYLKGWKTLEIKIAEEREIFQGNY